MSDVADWIIVGRFGRVHGIKGFITIHSFTHPRDNILEYTEWHVSMGGKWRPLELIEIEVNDKNILAKIKGYSEREAVAALTNLDIGISSTQLPTLPQGEFYWHQLIGLDVVNQANEHLGIVSEMLATGSNDVLVVTGDKKRLIPFLLDRYVLGINLEERRIIVEWDADF